MIPFANKAIIPIGIAGVLIYGPSVHWDALMHVQKGHTLLAPPHLAIIFALGLYGACGILALSILLGKKRLPGSRNTLLMIVTGVVILPVSLTIDELWHRLFGVDMTAWSPPHVFTTYGQVSLLWGLAVFEAHRKAETYRRLFSW